MIHSIQDTRSTWNLCSKKKSHSSWTEFLKHLQPTWTCLQPLLGLASQTESAWPPQSISCLGEQTYPCIRKKGKFTMNWHEFVIYRHKEVKTHGKRIHTWILIVNKDGLHKLQSPTNKSITSLIKESQGKLVDDM